MPCAAQDTTPLCACSESAYKGHQPVGGGAAAPAAPSGRQGTLLYRQRAWRTHLPGVCAYIYQVCVHTSTRC